MILFVFPLVGLLLDYLLPERKINYILFVAILLLLPLLNGYFYINSWLYQIFGLVALGCIYAYFAKKIKTQSKKIIISIGVSGLTFVIILFFSFMSSFYGVQTVENTWKNDHYKIEYIRDQGFSGRPLMKYELSKYSSIPVFEKKIETVIDNDTVHHCDLNFMKNKIVLNKCYGTIKELN